PTVYDYAHLGHARSEIVFDIIRRYLEYRGFKVNYIHNITDVDDKIIKKANEEGKTADEIAKKFTEKYLKDTKDLGIKPATVYPKATEHIQEMIALVKVLLDKGFAYPTSTGVYFEVSKFKEYGKLSKQNLEQLESGARVDVDEEKKSPLDFALWKLAKPGEPSWDSPWGKGRPGWHIECSAMSPKYLKRLDIHGGGRDLIFPHHENEIAQSEAASGKELARYWMHNGFINISGEKMSKSLGNIKTIRGILEKYGPWAVRVFILNGHYRGPMNFDEDALKQAKTGYERLCNTTELAKEAKDGQSDPTTDAELKKATLSSKQKFIEAMDDDFNSSFAVAELFALSSAINTYIGKEKINKDVLEVSIQTYCELAGSVGLEFENKDKGPGKKLEEIAEVARKVGLTPAGNAEAILEMLVKERESARKRKDYAKSDAVRKELDSIGIILEDKKEGVRWKLKG
ncbi:MAG: cysteine--tRNA ligase, partial [Candidatus Micrarchaeota archaeon]